jgi:hypothetical protein
VLNTEESQVFSKSASSSRVNYENPHLSVGLPVFAIHGNHDDPIREGGHGEALAALDVLAAADLINYFGVATNVEDITIKPILMRKGGTNVAIYGLGAMRDERLNRMWSKKAVHFEQLTEEQGKDSFFCIFVIHQNRDTGRGTKNCINQVRVSCLQLLSHPFSFFLCCGAFCCAALCCGGQCCAVYCIVLLCCAV